MPLFAYAYRQFGGPIDVKGDDFLLGIYTWINQPAYDIVCMSLTRTWSKYLLRCIYICIAICYIGNNAPSHQSLILIFVRFSNYRRSAFPEELCSTLPLPLLLASRRTSNIFFGGGTSSLFVGIGVSAPSFTSFFDAGSGGWPLGASDVLFPCSGELSWIQRLGRSLRPQSIKVKTIVTKVVIK